MPQILLQQVMILRSSFGMMLHQKQLPST
jgi:hypothetical protein